MLKYLIEIKHRFILINLNLLFNLISIYFYKETILFIVVEPTISTCFKEVGSSFYFIFTDITEIFATYSKLIFFLSGQISFAYFIYHFFLYLSPGMFFSEHRKSKGVLKLIFCIWISSIALHNYLFIPFSWYFFLSFQRLISLYAFIIHFEVKLKEYLLFYISSYSFCKFYFQIFLFYLIFLNYRGLNLVCVKKYRKIDYYIIIFFSVLVIPDFWVQFFLSCFLICIYECLIFLFLIKIL